MFLLVLLNILQSVLSQPTLATWTSSTPSTNLKPRLIISPYGEASGYFIVAVPKPNATVQHPHRPHTTVEHIPGVQHRPHGEHISQVHHRPSPTVEYPHQPHTPVEQSHRPNIPVGDPHRPHPTGEHTPQVHHRPQPTVEYPHRPHTPMEQLHRPHTPIDQPHRPHMPVEQPHRPTEHPIHPPGEHNLHVHNRPKPTVEYSQWSYTPAEQPHRPVEHNHRPEHALPTTLRPITSVHHNNHSPLTTVRPTTVDHHHFRPQTSVELFKSIEVPYDAMNHLEIEGLPKNIYQEIIAASSIKTNEIINTNVNSIKHDKNLFYLNPNRGGGFSPTKSMLTNLYTQVIYPSSQRTINDNQNELIEQGKSDDVTLTTDVSQRDNLDNNLNNESSKFKRSESTSSTSLFRPATVMAFRELFDQTQPKFNLTTAAPATEERQSSVSGPVFDTKAPINIYVDDPELIKVMSKYYKGSLAPFLGQQVTILRAPKK